jgi:hypothetical protein
MLRKTFAELAAAAAGGAEGGMPVQQAAAMMAHTQATLHQHYAVNHRVGLAQAGVQALHEMVQAGAAARGAAEEEGLEEEELLDMQHILMEEGRRVKRRRVDWNSISSSSSSSLGGESVEDGVRGDHDDDAREGLEHMDLGAADGGAAAEQEMEEVGGGRGELEGEEWEDWAIMMMDGRGRAAAAPRMHGALLQPGAQGNGSRITFTSSESSFEEEEESGTNSSSSSSSSE